MCESSGVLCPSVFFSLDTISKSRVFRITGKPLLQMKKKTCVDKSSV